MILSDILSIEEDHSNFTKSAKNPSQNLLNFQKFQLLSAIYQSFCEYQQNEFNFPQLDPLYTFLWELPRIQSEKSHMGLSNVHEPRNVDIKSIL